jgi:hypothetical protein
MRRLPDQAMIARRYANCADENIRRADTAINERERTYHALIAAQYWSLAERNCRRPFDGMLRGGLLRVEGGAASYERSRATISANEREVQKSSSFTAFS